MPNIEAQRPPGFLVLIPLGLGAAVPIVVGRALRLLGLDQAIFVFIGAGIVFFVVAAAFASTRLPSRGWLVGIFMFVGVPFGIIVDAIVDFAFFDRDRNLFPFEVALWWVLAIVPIPLGIYLGRSLAKH